MDGDVLHQYIEIWENTNNGNWTDATHCAVDNFFDAYKLLSCYDHFEFHGMEYLSLRDIAILSMYAERLRAENKENGWMNK